MKNNKIFYKNKQKGIALFIAILVSGVVLVIGAGVMEISLKEMKLSSLGRETSKAFYAADTGLECALYWDDITDTRGFQTIFPKNNLEVLDLATGFNCAGSITGASVVASDASSATTTFTVRFDAIDIIEPCANVTVSKVDSGVTVATTIESRGLNSCDSTNPRRSERGVKSTYTNIY